MRTVQVVLALALAGSAGGCATTGEETRTGQRSSAVKNEAVGGGSATVDPNAVSPEQLEELDMFFHRKIPQLQYDCYNPEVERTHKKYQGNMSVALVVLPGGKASEVKMTGSSLKSIGEVAEKAEGIETCVLDAIKAWEWPAVNAPAPYTGSINFKPAW
jgi:hypothetical protein